MKPLSSGSWTRSFWNIKTNGRFREAATWRWISDNLIVGLPAVAT